MTGVSDEAVEAAALALNPHGHHLLCDYANPCNCYFQHDRASARAALTAALPHMRQDTAGEVDALVARQAGRWRTERDAALDRATRAETALVEARGDKPSGFWSQREWEDWSNELSGLLPEDADSMYSNPEGAQESILYDCFKTIIAERDALVAGVRELAEGFDEPCDCGTIHDCYVDPESIAGDLRGLLPADDAGEAGE